MADPDVHSLFVEAHKLGIGGSPVSLWLLENAREFAAEMANVRRPNWSKLAATLYDRGSVGNENGAVSGRALRDAWYRVRLYLLARGETWVVIKDPPRGRGVRLVKRKRPALEPVVVAEPVQTDPAPAPAPVPEGPAAAPAFADLLEDTDRSRSWLPKTKGK